MRNHFKEDDSTLQTTLSNNINHLNNQLNNNIDFRISIKEPGMIGLSNPKSYCWIFFLFCAKKYSLIAANSRGNID
jgi:hypothetical protein